MADLSPNLSVYQALGHPQGQMDIGSLLGLVQRSRELQSQQAISDALKGSVDPETGQPDPTKATSQFLRSGAIAGPDDITRLTNAATSQLNLRQAALAPVKQIFSDLYAKSISPKGATVEDYNTRMPLLRAGGVPSSTLVPSADRLTGPDGKTLDPVKLAGFIQSMTGEAPDLKPSVSVMGPTGIQSNISPATIPYGGPAGMGGVSPGSVVTQTPAGAAIGLGAGHNLVADNIKANNWPAEMTPVRGMIHALKQPGVQTGVGSPVWNDLVNFANYSGLAKTIGMMPETTAANVDYEIARKYMRQMATNAAGGTNLAEVAAGAFSGNPNETLQTATNLTLSKTIGALRNLQHVGFMEFQREVQAGTPFQGHPLNANDYNLWYAQWASRQDPRAFGFDFMEDAEKKKMFSRMTKDPASGRSAELDKFSASLEAARRWGASQ